VSVVCFCAHGEPGEAKWSRTAPPEIHGAMPVTPDGGLLANGVAPIGASGFARFTSCNGASCGRAGDRQVSRLQKTARWLRATLKRAAPAPPLHVGDA